MNHASMSFVELNFSTSLAILDLVQPITNRIAEQLGFDEDGRYWIWLATQEALNNAVRHGNKMKPEKVIHFRVEMQNDQMVISIRDEGEGFDPGSVPDPTDPQNLLKSSGRGLFYMHKFMDDVSFQIKDGTQVTLTKKVNG